MVWNVSSGRPRLPRSTILRPVFWGGPVRSQFFESGLECGSPVAPISQQIATLTLKITAERLAIDSAMRPIVSEDVKAASVQTSPATKPPRPGSEFFALPDEIAASGRRLDVQARTLKAEMAETEKLATTVVQEKVLQQQTARDFINRMRKTADELGDNGAPPLLDGEENSSHSSASQRNGADHAQSQ